MCTDRGALDSRPTECALPTPTPTPPTPTTAPTMAPTPSADCSPAYGQCGGNNWGGPSCCEPGNFCFEQNEWYSQCVPGSGSASEFVVAAGRSTMPPMTTADELGDGRCIWTTP